MAAVDLGLHSSIRIGFGAACAPRNAAVLIIELDCGSRGFPAVVLLSSMQPCLLDGPGEDPNNRSHWGFLIHSQGQKVGNLLHVQLISLTGLVYQFEVKSGHPLESETCEGQLLLNYIEASKYHQVVSTISQQPAPRNNKDRCQDWTLECVIALEAEELVPAGTSTLVGGLIGKSAQAVATAAGQR
ncbi:hypothetical protein OPT61_g5540 [Boeremia exigua]|uniref:Uncharacterized protein n=1 Tax=Boeremia exigua TaxID=749465 RepID=A0ACC2IA02_9PLEO|nr:hypothetical protein OPT61_g5540 [Boeremia exigua]